MPIPEIIAGEALRTAVGTGAAYVLGKILGKREAKKVEQLRHRMCNLLWKMEFEVSPRLLPEVIRSEVDMGCIKPEESDDRLKKVMELREKYGLLSGANVFLSPTGVAHTVPKASVPEAPKDAVKIEELQAKAMREIGPPLSDDTGLKGEKGR